MFPTSLHSRNHMLMLDFPQHQRLFDGRPMRVQLRELKPPSQRTPFRMTRGRAKSRVFDDSPYRLGGSIDFHVSQAHDDPTPGISPRSIHSRPMSYQDPRFVANLVSSESPHLFAKSEATESSSHSVHPVHATEHQATSHHEDANVTMSWRQPLYPPDLHPEPPTTGSRATSASISPPPSSSSSHPSSVIGAMPPYPMMMPWMQPYSPYGYPMHYFPPYMGYPQPMFPYPPTQEIGGVNIEGNIAQQPTWQGPVSAYKVKGSLLATDSLLI